jgi:hypothetical protein
LRKNKTLSRTVSRTNSSEKNNDPSEGLFAGSFDIMKMKKFNFHAFGTRENIKKITFCGFLLFSEQNSKIFRSFFKFFSVRIAKINIVNLERVL